MVQPSKVVSAVTEDLDQAIIESGASIQVGDLPEIRGYPKAFNQLILNLVSNAIKYRKKDVSPQIEVGVEKRREDWLFWGKDNGVGIPSEQFSRVFQIFQRLHHKHQYAGTGIGLAICQKVVEIHKGKIWVESEVGVGSTFFFTIYQNLKDENPA